MASTERPEDLGRLAQAARCFVETVDAHAARRLVQAEGGRWIDLREPGEHTAGEVPLPGALVLRLPELRLLATVLLTNREQPLIVVDADGERGRLGAVALAQRGYTRAVHLRGGIRSLGG